MYYNGNNKLEYNAGRDNNGSEQRSPCNVDPVTNECVDTQNLITNSKVFMVANVGIGKFLNIYKSWLPTMVSLTAGGALIRGLMLTPILFVFLLLTFLLLNQPKGLGAE